MPLTLQPRLETGQDIRDGARREKTPAAPMHRAQSRQSFGFAVGAQVPVTQPDHAVEGDADRLADAVAFRAPGDQVGRRSPLASAPPSVADALQSPSRALTADERPAGLDVDFTRVQVHADSRAAASARELAAAAYTVGDRIVVGEGYDSRSLAGRRLIAHELAHVALQRGHGGSAPTVYRNGAVPTGRRFFDMNRGGLTAAEKTLLVGVRRQFNLPVTPTPSDQTIVGVLILETGEQLPIHSGRSGGPYGGVQRGGVPRGPGSGATRYNITHVESHATAIMRQRGVKQGILLIEKEPCAACAGYTKAQPDVDVRSPNVSSLLPDDAQLLVVDPDSTTYFRSAHSSGTPPTGMQTPTGGAAPEQSDAPRARAARAAADVGEAPEVSPPARSQASRPATGPEPEVEWQRVNAGRFSAIRTRAGSIADTAIKAMPFIMALRSLHQAIGMVNDFEAQMAEVYALQSAPELGLEALETPELLRSHYFIDEWRPNMEEELTWLREHGEAAVSAGPDRGDAERLRRVLDDVEDRAGKLYELDVECRAYAEKLSPALAELEDRSTRLARFIHAINVQERTYSWFTGYAEVLIQIDTASSQVVHRLGVYEAALNRKIGEYTAERERARKEWFELAQVYNAWRPRHLEHLRKRGVDVSGAVRSLPEQMP